MDDAAIEQDLGRICDAIENLQGFFVLGIVVMCECLHPGLDFLSLCQLLCLRDSISNMLTCLSDMAVQNAFVNWEYRVGRNADSLRYLKRGLNSAFGGVVHLGLSSVSS